MKRALTSLSLGLRRRSPERVKAGLRMARLLVTPVPPRAPTIPQPQLDGCRVWSDRLVMLDHLPHGGRIAEIGTQRGHFAREILRRCAPAALHLVDLDFGALETDVRTAPAVHLHQDLSTAALDRFDDESFDWIYIDADHSYRGVQQDIAAAAPKVAPGGYLVFNDFARIVRPGVSVFGVHQAVCEFAVASGWPLAHLCLEGEALYDVALRKPMRTCG